MPSRRLFVFVMAPFAEINHVYYFFTTFISFGAALNFYISSQIKTKPINNEKDRNINYCIFSMSIFLLRCQCLNERYE